MNETSGRQARRQAIVRRALLGSFGLGLVTGAGAYIATDMNIRVPPGFILAGGALLIALALLGSIIHWRNIDEAAREAHKFAWFWGGSTAMVFPIPALLLLGEARMLAMFGPHSPAEWVLIGMGAMLLPPLVGYGLVWAGWWLRQR